MRRRILRFALRVLRLLGFRVTPDVVVMPKRSPLPPELIAEIRERHERGERVPEILKACDVTVLAALKALVPVQYRKDEGGDA